MARICDVHTGDQCMTPTLYNAIIECNSKKVKRLVKQKNIDLTDSLQLSLNLIESQSDNFIKFHSLFIIAETLLDHREDINTKNNKNESIFNFCIQYVKDNLLKHLLVTHQYAIHQSTFFDALKFAVSHGSSDSVLLLLEFGKITYRYNYQYDDIFFAMAACGEIDGMHWLIKHGCDINAVDHEGRTALMRATNCGQHNMIQFLLAQGADALITDDHGKSASDWIINPNHDTCALLESAYENQKLLKAIPDSHSVDDYLSF